MQFRELLEGGFEGAPKDTHRWESHHLRDLRQIGLEQGLSPNSYAYTLGGEAARVRSVRQSVQRSEISDRTPENAHGRKTVRVQGVPEKVHAAGFVKFAHEVASREKVVSQRQNILYMCVCMWKGKGRNRLLEEETCTNSEILTWKLEFWCKKNIFIRLDGRRLIWIGCIVNVKRFFYVSGYYGEFFARCFIVLGKFIEYSLFTVYILLIVINFQKVKLLWFLKNFYYY